MIGTQKPRGVEFDIRKLFRFYLKKWWLILLCGALLACAAYFYTANFVTPLYQASVTIYVNNTKSGQVDSITGSSLTASQQLVSTYINMIRSDTVLDKVVDSLGEGYSASYIRSAMSAQQVDNTELFYVIISGPDPERIALIANTVAEIAPREIESFVDGSSTKIIDYAKVPSRSYYPSYGGNTQLGGLVGCLLAVMFLTLHHLLDVKLDTEEDFEQMFDIPVLGSIPIFYPNEKNHGHKNSPRSS
ncbi:MAG: YveK family protein [Oscillospiraceae bacterium]|jgi:capsular polysaccharide biosynthesis protein